MPRPTLNDGMRQLADSLHRSLTPAQLRERRWALVERLVQHAAIGLPTWQECVDVALQRDAAVQARIVALGLLAQHYPDFCALVLSNVVTDPAQPMALRVVAAELMASSESITMAGPLARAIDNASTGVPLTTQAPQLRVLATAGAPNELRTMMCVLAVDLPAGRRTLQHIFRHPDQYRRGWASTTAVLLALGNDAEGTLAALATMVAQRPYGQNTRADMLRMLYFVRTTLAETAPFDERIWQAIRQIWSEESGELKALAAELLKLQGAR